MARTSTLTARRLGRIAAPVALVAGLSACGGDDGLADLPSVTIQPTSFVVEETASTSASTVDPDDETRASGTQDYTVESGDFLFRIAEKFDVSADDIVSINDWEDGVEHRLDPDDEILIPPGGLLPEFQDEDDEDEDESDEEESDEEESEEDEDGEARCPNGELQGTYELEEGDFPASVADQLGVTVDELRKANANTPGYSSFIVGTEILVPCEDD